MGWLRRCLSDRIRFPSDRALVACRSKGPTQPRAEASLHHQSTRPCLPSFVSALPPPHYSEIPIAPAAPSSPHYSRVPSLEAFGRRPRCLPRRCDGPASETLHKTPRALCCRPATRRRKRTSKRGAGGRCGGPGVNVACPGPDPGASSPAARATSAWRRFASFWKPRAPPLVPRTRLPPMMGLNPRSRPRAPVAAAA